MFLSGPIVNEQSLQPAAGLGAASHDTGWRQDFYIHAGPFGGVVGFQRSYWAYRRTCWFADSFCLLSGRRIADDAEVFVGWSVGPAGWVSEPEVSSRATTAEGIIGELPPPPVRDFGWP